MNNMKFSEVLFSEVKEIWDGYLEHPFVKAIGEGHLDLDFHNFKIDTMSISAHKFGGPKGVGQIGRAHV